MVDSKGHGFGRFRMPAEFGGGDLVMRVLSAGEVDKVLQLQSSRVADVLEELIAESIHSVRGELFERGSVRTVAWLRSRGSKTRDFLEAAYGHLHNVGKDEEKAIKRSRKIVNGLHRFTVPGSDKLSPEQLARLDAGEDIGEQGEFFYLREMTAGEVNDALATASDTGTAVMATNMLVVASVQRVGDTPTPHGDDGLKWLAGLTNKTRTMYAEAYAFLHDTTAKDTAPFIAGCEMLSAPPKAI